MSSIKVNSSQSTVEGGSPKKGTGKEKDNSGLPDRTPSAEEVKCAICLGEVVNRSCSNSCLHQFCFGCLLEWSKVKPECPLCKSSFRSIYHNFRSSTEYDEYVVPTPPVPHLSIRLTAAGANYRLSPDIMMVRDGDVATYGLDLSMRDDFRDRRFIRVLEARAGHSHHQHTPMSHSHRGQLYDGWDFPHHHHAPFLLAPFSSAASSAARNSRPEFFGDMLPDYIRPQHHPTLDDTSNMPGYQNRRRHYDRDEWVQPFGATLQPGSVIFQSVEYFQSHPSAAARLHSWLMRELHVLLGVTRGREHVNFMFDMIMNLINFQDIRSPQMRDSISRYLGPRTLHFQHELYHFLISGMSMEEYDRVAEYGTRRTTTTSAPEVITLDSDDEDTSNSTARSTNTEREQQSDDIILVESSDDEQMITRPYTRSESSRAQTKSSRTQAPAVASSSSSLRSQQASSLNSAVPSSSTRSGLVRPFADYMNSIVEQRIRDERALNIDLELRRMQADITQSRSPNADAASVGLTGSRLGTVIDRSRAAAATTTVTTASGPYNMTLDRSQATAATATLASSGGRNASSSSSSPASSFPNPPNHSRPTVASSSGSRRNEFLLDAFDLDMNISLGPYSSPPLEPNHRGFPVLDYRREREQQGGWLPLPSRERNRNLNAESRSNTPSRSENFRDLLRPSALGTGSRSAFSPFESPSNDSTEELRRPPRPSVHMGSNDNRSSSAAQSTFRIDLFPRGISNAQVMDLSRSAGLIPSVNKTNSTASASQEGSALAQSYLASSGESSVIVSANARYDGMPKLEREGREPVPPTADDSDSDDLECIGSFPIQKKPPLAVITLSSDDEDGPKIKPERNEQPNTLSGDDSDLLVDFMQIPDDIEVADFSEFLDQNDPIVSDVQNFISSNSSSSHFGDIVHSLENNHHVVEPSTSSGLKLTIRTDGPQLMNPTPSSSKRRSSSNRDNEPRPKRHKQSKRSRRSRLTIFSSSDSTDDEGASRPRSPPSPPSASEVQSQSHSLCIPKKRRLIRSPPPPPIFSPSSSDDSKSSGDDSQYRVLELDSSSSKKHSSPTKKKKHKSKSRKSKKSKKSKDKSKEKSCSKKTGGGTSSSSSRAKESGSSGTRSTPGGSNSSGNSKISHHAKKREEPRTVQPTASSASTINMHFPICDFDDNDANNDLLDLSFNHRTDDAPLLPQVMDSDENAIDFRIQPPSVPPSASTVDPSAIFGSPSRTIFNSWWDDYSTSDRRGWND